MVGYRETPPNEGIKLNPREGSRKNRDGGKAQNGMAWRWPLSCGRSGTHSRPSGNVWWLNASGSSRTSEVSSCVRIFLVRAHDGGCDARASVATITASHDRGEGSLELYLRWTRNSEPGQEVALPNHRRADSSSSFGCDPSFCLRAAPVAPIKGGS